MYDSLSGDCMTVFTDGSSLNKDHNPLSPSQAGAGVYITDGRLDAKLPPSVYLEHYILKSRQNTYFLV